MNDTALLKIEQKPLAWLSSALNLPEIELSALPAKLSQRLWVSPEEFLQATSAPVLAQWAGLMAAYQHTALVYCTMLAVALIAHRYQRPELAGSRTRVLAVKTLS